MTGIQFPAEWAIRSSILILCGALLLRALRVKDASIRLAAWTAMLCGSLAMPVLAPVLPGMPLAVLGPASGRTDSAAAIYQPSEKRARPDTNPEGAAAKPGADVSRRFDRSRAAISLYALVAFMLLLRVAVGVSMSLRLLRASRTTGRAMEGIEIRESDHVAAPVTLGILHPAIILPADWERWDGPKLDAVLAHERSHVQRFDPALQLLSAIHRALLWHSPLSWFLHKRIVGVAEEVSDDAAVAAIGDAALYAEVLLDFIRRGVTGTSGIGVPMARYGRPDRRIQRILDGTRLSRGITRWTLLAILALGSPLAWIVATAHPQTAPSQPAARPAVEESAHADYSPPAVSSAAASRERSLAQQAAAPTVAPVAAQPRTAPVFLNALGNVTAFYTVSVRPRIDGLLTSVSFKEGDLVQAGQVLASIDPRPFQLQLAQAEGQLRQDEGFPANNLLDGKLKTDQAIVDNAKLELSYAQITAPITGVAGLRLIDPGNVVHAADASAIVVITQLQPIAVLFQIPEDYLPAVRTHLREAASVPVEAWNRDSTIRLATGHLIAVDNQIDMSRGTVRLKAVFDNQDGALFPNQFVNIRVRMN